MNARRAIRALLGSALVLALVAAVASGASGASSPKVVVIKTKSMERWVPDKKNPPSYDDEITLGWYPGTITVHHGQTIKVVDADNFGDPHVLAIALKKDLPKKPSPNPFGNKIVQKIAPELLVNPAAQNPQFKAYSTNAGAPGLNQEGDSLVILPGGPHKTATAVISAKAGTTLYYFCAIHWWMQGEIKVIK